LKAFLDELHGTVALRRSYALALMQDFRYQPQAVGGGPLVNDVAAEQHGHRK
jgi:hypothetical protein